MHRPIILFFLLGCFLFSCKTASIYFSHPYEKITTLPGPEDMVLDTTGAEPIIIISCAQCRKKETFVSGIQAYNLVTNQVNTFTLINFPDSIRLNPHGLDLGMQDGKKILWVINHEDEKKRQSILKFRVEELTLVLEKQFVDRHIISPNDICDGGNGTFYFTNDASSRNSGLELLFKVKGGSIIYYNGTEFTRYKQQFAYPNGIIKFNNRLFFSTSRQNRIFAIQLNERGEMVEDSVELIVKGTSWDNFSIHGDHLVCTTHTHPMKFLKHRKHSKHESPCQVYTINPITKTKGIVYHTDGESISAGSTAIYYKGDLYICQVFDPFILKVALHNY